MIFCLLFSIFVTGLFVYNKLIGSMRDHRLIKAIISVTFSFSILGILYPAFLFLGCNIVLFYIFLIGVNMYMIISMYKKNLIGISNYTNIDKLAVVFALFCLIGTVKFWMFSNRWGDWDAWAVWNLHALFLIDIESWTNLFSDKIAWTHPDYPLMLPSVVALFWASIGDQIAEIPALVSYFSFLLLIGLLYSSFEEGYSRIIGLFSIIILLMDNRFMANAASQQADLLISLMILLSVVMRNKKIEILPLWYFMMGFFAALPMWIKNEGVVFFIIYSLIIFYRHRKYAANLVSYVFGVLPVALVLFCFKFFYATTNDITGSLNINVIDKIISIDRYEILGNYLYDVLIQNFPVALLLIVMAMVLRPRSIISDNSLTILLTFSSYLFVYIITPNELVWHLSTSLDRLIYHLYPAIIFLSCMTIVSVCERECWVLKEK